MGTPVPGWRASVAVGFHLQVPATGRWSKSPMRGQVKAVVSNSKRVCPCLNQIEHYQTVRCRSCSPAGSHGIQDCPRWAAVVCSGCCVQLWFEQNCVGAENPVRAGRIQLQLNVQSNCPPPRWTQRCYRTCVASELWCPTASSLLDPNARATTPVTRGNCRPSGSQGVQDDL